MCLRGLAGIGWKGEGEEGGGGKGREGKRREEEANLGLCTTSFCRCLFLPCARISPPAARSPLSSQLWAALGARPARVAPNSGHCSRKRRTAHGLTSKLKLFDGGNSQFRAPIERSEQDDGRALRKRLSGATERIWEQTHACRRDRGGKSGHARWTHLGDLLRLEFIHLDQRIHLSLLFHSRSHSRAQIYAPPLYLLPLVLMGRRRRRLMLLLLLSLGPAGPLLLLHLLHKEIQ